MSELPWDNAALRPAGPDDLPAQVDVAVVGGGLAGLAVAGRLAAAGASVALCEARSGLARGADGRDAGLALLGVGDSPLRLAAALGDDIARDITRFTAENLDLVAELGALERSGGLHVGKARESAEIPAV